MLKATGLHGIVKFAIWLLLPVATGLFCSEALGAESHAQSSGENISRTSALFLESLSSEQRDSTVYSFSSDERYNWHYFPKVGKRKGVPFKEMSVVQREAAGVLMQSSMSYSGLDKALDVIKLEGILGILEGGFLRRIYRDPEKYYITLFNTESPDAPWGWRLEGHHLSLNYVIAGETMISATPAFFGANPAIVPSGPDQGLQVLKPEEMKARKLVKSLKPGQLEKALISKQAPRDIVTGVDRQVLLQGFEGISAKELTQEQQDMLIDLVSLYLKNHNAVWADRKMEEIRATWPDTLYFAWAGSLEPGVPHYYRIHGPSILIEYDNTQNNATHVHTVLRDPRNDFGGDILKRHYADADHHRHLY